MRRLADLVVRRRVIVLICGALFLVIAGALGNGVVDRLSVGGYTNPNTESAQADAILSNQLHLGQPNFILLVTDARGVDDPAVVAAGTALTARVAAEPSVQDATSYWVAGRPPSLRSTNGDKALILVRVKGDDDEVQRHMKTLAPRYAGTVNGLHVRLGGLAEANSELTDVSTKDATRAESVALPITLLALILVFGSVVAAVIPVGLGIIAIIGVLLVMRLVTGITPVSILALNFTTIFGLGLAIDYSLFIVTRYREELRNGRDVPTAIAITMSTAGRTVLFSAITVALALSVLVLFPFEFIRSFAYAGVPTALFAALASLVLLPAFLAVLGPRIDRLRVFRRRQAGAVETGFWHRLATRVMRHALPVLLIVVAFLLLLGVPFLHLRMSLADERTLPPTAGAFQVAETIRHEFPSQEAESVLVVAQGVDPSATSADITGYARRLSELKSVSRVDAVTGSFAGGAQIAPASPASARFGARSATYLQVVPTVAASSDAGRDLLHAVRGTAAPFPVKVTGLAASFQDSLDDMYRSLPVAFGLIALSMIVLLFLMTASLVVPLKAIVLNVLNLAATFGILVWGFQDGHLRGWIGDFTVIDSITWSVLVLLFCVAFGLSMDYEVFILSRIKEEYDATGDNTRAVARGLERTGRLVTAAALVISIVFISGTTSSVQILKVLALGLAIAVVLDATVVRALAVPAFMRLAGRVNWWAPGPLKRLHARLGVGGSALPPSPALSPRDRATSSCGSGR